MTNWSLEERVLSVPQIEQSTVTPVNTQKEACETLQERNKLLALCSAKKIKVGPQPASVPTQ